MYAFILTLSFLTATVVGQNGNISSPSVKIHDLSSGRVRGFKSVTDTDFYLGGLMRVHTDIRGVQCSESFSERGVEETEAFLLAIDSINNDPNLLPNITIGYDVRDYCGSDNIALDEVSEWIWTPDVQTSSALLAVVGAFHSRVSIPVATFLRPFQVPQVSHGSTSPSLSDRDRYTFFLRTVPPDTLQSRVIVDLMKTFGWTVVSAVHSNEEYGNLGIEQFRSLASEAGICLDLDEEIDEDFAANDYAKLARTIYDSEANVTLLFSLEVYVAPLLRAVKAIKPPRRFVWIGTDTWTASRVIQEEFGDMLVGMLGTVPSTPNSQEFDDYYEQVTPFSNARDPFFEDYCVDFLSSIGETCTNETAIPDLDGYSQSTFTPFLIEAVHSIAHGLNNFLAENCDPPVEWIRANHSCKGQKMPLTGSTLLDYISSVSFRLSSGDTFGFDKLGNPAFSMYRVLNYQRSRNGQNQLRTIGNWDSTSNQVNYANLSEVQFGLTESGDILTFLESQCVVCAPGQVQVQVPLSCCYVCQACLGNTFSNSTTSTECVECGEFMWGNNPVNGSDGCVPLEEEFLSYDDPEGIVVLILTFIGIASMTTVSVLIGIFWINPVIKSFGREQLVLIICGLTASFLVPIVYIFRPSILTCTLQHVGNWFCTTLMLAALLVKLIRVTRIFLSGAQGGRRHFIKPWHQVLFTFLIVAGHMVIVLVSIAVTPPSASFELDVEVDSAFPILNISCVSPHISLWILLVLYDIVLVILVNGFAILTIRFPENFNEARHIAFATFGIGVVWLAFVPTYFATSNNAKVQAESVALSMTLVAYCILICLICPRLYVALRTKEIKMTSDLSKTKEQSIECLQTGNGHV